MSRHIKTLAIPFAFLGSIVLLGCGDDDGIGKRYPLSGKVTYNGQGVAHGTINFLPEAGGDGKGAVGEIKDGAYRNVTTLTPDDGILPGKYKVTIVAYDVADLSNLQAKAAGGATDQVQVAKANAKAKNQVPMKYARAETSGLTHEAKAKSDTYDADLKE